MIEFINYLQKNTGLLTTALLEHAWLAYVSVLLGILVAVPLGIVFTRFRKVGKKALAVLSVFQTVPSLVMFGFLIPITGIGKPSTVIVLTLYSLLPILRNTYTGICEVPDNYIEAAAGMGMSGAQVLFQVELPIAAPVIITGIRLASVYIISWATVAAIIGGGGLGDLIITGMERYNRPLLLLGAIPASLLAIATSFVIGQIAKLATPAGMKR